MVAIPAKYDSVPSKMFVFLLLDPLPLQPSALLSLSSPQVDQIFDEVIWDDVGVWCSMF